MCGGYGLDDGGDTREKERNAKEDTEPTIFWRLRAGSRPQQAQG